MRRQADEFFFIAGVHQYSRSSRKIPVSKDRPDPSLLPLSLPFYLASSSIVLTFYFTRKRAPRQPHEARCRFTKSGRAQPTTEDEIEDAEHSNIFAATSPVCHILIGRDLQDAGHHHVRAVVAIPEFVRLNCCWYELNTLHSLILLAVHS